MFCPSHIDVIILIVFNEEKSTYYEAPLYAVFSSLLPLPSPRMDPDAFLCVVSKSPPICVRSLGQETKFRTHTKQKVLLKRFLQKKSFVLVFWINGLRIRYNNGIL